MRGREYLHGGGRDAVGRDNSPDDGWGSHLESAAERHECSLWRVVRGREYRHRGGRQRDDSPDDGRGCHLDAADGRGAWFWFPWRVVRGREYLHGGGRLRDDSPDNDRRPLIVERQAKHDTISATATPKGGAAERSIAALNQRSARLHSISAAAVKISEDRVPCAILVDREYDARVIHSPCAHRRALQDQQLITQLPRDHSLPTCNRLADLLTRLQYSRRRRIGRCSHGHPAPGNVAHILLWNDLSPKSRANGIRVCHRPSPLLLIPPLLRPPGEFDSSSSTQTHISLARSSTRVLSRS